MHCNVIHIVKINNNKQQPSIVMQYEEGFFGAMYNYEGGEFGSQRQRVDIVLGNSHRA